MNKRILIPGIIVIILIVLLVVLSLASNKDEARVSDDVVAQIEPLDTALSLVATNSNTAIYFDRGDKTFYELTGDSREKLITLDYEPFTVVYSPDKTKAMAIAEFNNFARPITVIDFVAKTTKAINEKVFNATFSPDSQYIAFHYKDDVASESILYASNPDTTGLREIKTFPYLESDSYIVKWPEPDYLWYMLITSDISEVAIERININTKKTETVAQGYFHDFKIAPGAKNFAVIAPAATGRDEDDVDLSDYDNVYLQIGAINEPLFVTTVKTNSALITWNPGGNLVYALGRTETGSALYRVKMDGSSEVLVENPVEDVRAIIELVYLNDDTLYAIQSNKAVRIDINK